MNLHPREAMQTISSWLKSPRVQLALLLLVIAAVTSLKFSNGFIYDDLQVIVYGDKIHHVENISSILVNRAMWATPDAGDAPTMDLSALDTWRPLTMLTFVWDAQLSGREPWAYHLTNLLAHLGVVALVWGLARRLLPSGQEGWALAAAAFFGFHPVGTEAHIWINGRSDLFAALFGVAALWVLAGGRSWGRGAAAGGLFLLGCLSKEVLLMAAPLFPLSVLLWPQEVKLDGWRARFEAMARASWGPALAGMLYLPARMWALAGLKALGRPDDQWTVLSRVPLVLLESLSAAIIPQNVYFRHVFEEYQRVAGWELGVAACGLVVLAAVLFVLRRRVPVLCWSLVGFGLLLSPTALITMTQGWWGFNRYLYLPLALLSVGLASSLGLGVPWLRERLRPSVLRLAWVGLALFGLLELSLYVSAIFDLQDEAHFYQSIIAYDPESSHGYYGWGGLLLRAKRFPESAEQLRVAYQLNPDNAKGRTNLLITLIESGAFEEAQLVGEQSIREWPENPAFYMLFAAACMDSQPERTGRLLLEGLLLDAQDPYIKNHLRRALHEHPRHAEYQAMLNLLLEEPRYSGLRPVVEQALQP